MAVSWGLLVTLSLVLLITWCLYHINRGLSKTPEEIAKIAGKPWSEAQILEVYEKYQTKEPNFQKYLPPKQQRRYVVFGGSGQYSYYLKSLFPFLE